MSRHTIQFTNTLYAYYNSVGYREEPILTELRTLTDQLPQAEMRICPEEGQLLALLVELIDAKKVLEVGAFTGYSTLWIALAMQEDGRIVTCDLNEKWAEIAIRYWDRAGVLGKIDLRIAHAHETLASLLSKGEAGTFDFAFIDADKGNYDVYYEHSLQLLRPGGIMAIDNVFLGGKVASPVYFHDHDTITLRKVNAKLHEDQRISTLSMLPIGDGLTLAKKL